MLMIVDGPEKAGKSTLVTRLREACRPYHDVVAHFRYPQGFTPTAFLDAVRLGARRDALVIVDRCWPSDVVYSRLVRRAEPAVPDYWYEWTLGLPAMTLGLRIIALPKQRLAPSTPDDHPLSWVDEAGAFEEYARAWGWDVVNPLSVDPRELWARCVDVFHAGPRAPQWAGARDPRLVWVGDARNTRSREPLAWAPLSTRYWKKEVAEREHEVMSAWPNVATTNAADADDSVFKLIRGAEVVVAYGQHAAGLLKPAVPALVARTHPAARYRWGKYTKTENNDG